MKTTRRTFLGGLAAVSVPSGAAVAAAMSPAALTGACHGAEETPELIAAYDRFLVARTEVLAAEDVLKWLVDEWRHRWPLAPLEILGFANADEYTENAERDIAGRIIKRNTADFGTKFTAKWQKKYPRTCFSLLTPEGLQDIVNRWEKPRTGKTKKALARNLAEQARALVQYRNKLRLSEQYHTETARLREASGVEQVKQRIKPVVDRS